MSSTSAARACRCSRARRLAGRLRAACAASGQRLCTGVRELDPMLHGGVLRGTHLRRARFFRQRQDDSRSALPEHRRGSGRTRRAVRLLRVRASAFIRAGSSIGLNLRGARSARASSLTSGSLPTSSGSIALGARLLDEIERIGAKRVVIDSFDGFRQAAFDPTRTIRFITALLGELRARGNHDHPDRRDHEAVGPRDGNARRRHLGAGREFAAYSST